MLRWKTADTVFVVQSFSFQVWMYSPSVAMCLLRKKLKETDEIHLKLVDVQINITKN